MSSETRSSGWFAHGGLVIVLCCFCIPLFVGLRGWDVRNDEAIYSYAIESILDTGDWLTPALPGGVPFLEKPPLKFWIVAAAIRAGLLPNDEFGLRFFDALFGAISFVYVFYLGRLLAGSLCGIVAPLILFTIDPLLFSHGLRENGMDASLVLAYCGAMFHFARWVEGNATGRRSIHALAVAAYFTLGFMTKFVAVLFLPVVCALAFMWRDDALGRVRAQWREWIPATLVVLAATAPWFIYQTLHSGSLLWQTMFGQHVYVRFTSALDPRQLEPWHFYFSFLRLELAVAGSLLISTIGVLMLAHKAWTGRPWVARLVIVWWIVPFALMSIGTSKMFHYTYPFLPPIALGAGLVVDRLFRALERAIALSVRTALKRPLRAFVRSRAPSRAGSLVRQLFAALAVLALALAVWTAVAGRVRWEINGVQLLQNSSVARPLIIAGVLFCLTGYARVVSAGMALAAVAVLLPVPAYPLKLERAASLDRPLHTVRDCVLGLKAPPRDTHAYPTYISHSYYYYLRHLGPWVAHRDESPNDDDLQRLLLVPGEQTIMVLLRTDYERFVEQIAKARRIPIGLELSADSAEVLMTPGPFEVCGAAAVATGAPGIVGRVDANRQ
jgi:4-amino-4-deoxy-L-arabinose transferase-like glycosyltransferase